MIHRLNFELCCDWFKISHMVQLLACNLIIPPPILLSRVQLEFGALRVGMLVNKLILSNRNGQIISSGLCFEQLRN